MTGAPANAADSEPQGWPVIITGVEDELLDNVEIYLEVEDGRIPEAFEFGSSGLETWRARARDALQALGYFQPEIDITRPPADAESGTVTIAIRPGPPTLIESMEVRVTGPGASDPWFREYLADLPLQKGERLNQGAYETIKTRLRSIATDYGYFRARFVTRELQVDPVLRSARIRLLMETGERNRIGDIKFVTDAITQELLARYQVIESGKYFDNAVIFEQQQALQQSGYFSQVFVEAASDPEQPLVTNITFRMEPSKRYELKFSTGYTTDLGARVGMTLNNRRISRNGNHYNFSAQFAQQGYTFNLDYIIPGAKPRTDNLTLNLQRAREEDDLGDNLIDRIGPVWNRQMDNGWLQSYSIQYVNEDFSGKSGQDLDIQYLLPSINVNNLNKDHPIFVSRGYRWNLEFIGSSGAISDPEVDFLQIRFDNKWVLPMWADHRLLLRGNAGTTFFSGDDFFERMPPSLRFRTGGDNSVRGYRYNSVGLSDSEDNLLGGKHLLVGSIEYEIPVYGNWSVAAFADAGDAFVDSPDFKRSIGLGVRWNSPVGPIRVDFAQGLDDPEEFRFHFSIGPDL